MTYGLTLRPVSTKYLERAKRSTLKSYLEARGVETYPKMSTQELRKQALEMSDTGPELGEEDGY